MAMAQTPSASTIASTTPLDSGTTPAIRQRIRGFRQSSNIQPQVAALGTTAVASLPMPILFGVTPSNISPNFGDPRTNHPHQGEDLLAPKGTPIVSPTAAVVLRLESGATEGNGLYTSNPGGETFVYYHLDRYAEGIATGQVLAPGSLIGYVGDTGDAAGGPPHLHFEIHNNAGVPIDPFPRLTSEFAPAEKMTYLTNIFTRAADINALARFLVANFRTTFLNALAANVLVPTPIVQALATMPGSASVTGSAGGTLPSGDLDLNSSGATVVALQKYLTQAASGAAATRLAKAGATGNFGPITKAALVEFQVRSGITPATGYYGPTTRAFVAAHPLGTAAVPSVPGSSVSASAALTRDIEQGSSGEDVRTLQKMLNANGYQVAASGSGSAGNETIFFGPATKAAVIRYQIARGIAPALGYVGPITRASLASL
jgi:peptidoglycan hydrolase-like protein with peptidoglycan-binding domain